MFCRFCAASIEADSRFCPKCGKRLLTSPSARGQRLLRHLHLDTPYPYTGFLFLVFVVWILGPSSSDTDYSAMRISLELEGESGRPEENIFRHHLSLVLENLSSEVIRDVPVEFRVRIEPERSGEVLSDFLGRRLVILRDGETLPVIVVLADPVEASARRRYSIDGIVVMEPPVDLTYEVLAVGSGEILASLPAGIRRASPNQEGPLARLW